jgi:hypothetical protein
MAEENNETKNEPVTITATPAGPSPLIRKTRCPRASFMWRRLFAAVIGGERARLRVVRRRAGSIDGGAHGSISTASRRLMIYGAGLILTYYFVAPSASELTNMLATASI